EQEAIAGKARDHALQQETRANKAREEEKAQRGLAEKEKRKALASARLAEERLVQVRSGTYNWGLSQLRDQVERDPDRARAQLEDAERFPLDLRDFTWANLHRRATPLRHVLRGTE